MTDFLDTDPILYAGLIQVIRRGSAEILAQSAQGIFLRDTVSGVRMLAAADPSEAAAWLRAQEEFRQDLIVLFRRGPSEQVQAECASCSPARRRSGRTPRRRHLAGCMGLREVFPAYRRQGFGTELECFMIARMLAEGLIPYCQVEFGNHRSLCLQRKLGMTIPDAHIYWLC